MPGADPAHPCTGMNDGKKDFKIKFGLAKVEKEEKKRPRISSLFDDEPPRVTEDAAHLQAATAPSRRAALGARFAKRKFIEEIFLEDESEPGKDQDSLQQRFDMAHGTAPKSLEPERSDEACHSDSSGNGEISLNFKTESNVDVEESTTLSTSSEPKTAPKPRYAEALLRNAEAKRAEFEVKKIKRIISERRERGGDSLVFLSDSYKRKLGQLQRYKDLNAERSDIYEDLMKERVEISFKPELDSGTTTAHEPASGEEACDAGPPNPPSLSTEEKVRLARERYLLRKSKRPAQ